MFSPSLFLCVLAWQWLHFDQQYPPVKEDAEASAICLKLVDNLELDIV